MAERPKSFGAFFALGGMIRREFANNHSPQIVDIKPIPPDMSFDGCMVGEGSVRISLNGVSARSVRHEGFYRKLVPHLMETLSKEGYITKTDFNPGGNGEGEGGAEEPWIFQTHKYSRTSGILDIIATPFGSIEGKITEIL